MYMKCLSEGICCSLYAFITDTGKNTFTIVWKAAWMFRYMFLPSAGVYEREDSYLMRIYHIIYYVMVRFVINNAQNRWVYFCRKQDHVP